MFEIIKFFIHGKKIYINDQQNGYDLGELATDFLNLKEDYMPMFDKIQKVKEKAEVYVESQNLEDWWELNNYLWDIDKVLMRYKLFKAARPDDFKLFEDTMEYTGQQRLFPDDNIFDLKRLLPEPVEQEDGSYRFKPTDFTEEEAINSIMNSHTLMIAPGDRNAKWAYYEAAINKYDEYLHDIRAFNITIQNFIDYGLANLTHLNPSNYAATLGNYLTNDRWYKWIVNPVQNRGDSFNKKDDVRMWHFPYVIDGDENNVAIFDCYEVDTVQALLKSDFFKALSVGHLIRKCKHCGNYFLQKRAYHTMYCDRPSPEDSNYTCHQVGSRVKKELAENLPKSRSWKSAGDRISKDAERGIITLEEKLKLLSEVRDMLTAAITKPGIGDDEFEQMLQSDVLYPRFGINRRTKPRGRPKKVAE